MRSLFLVITLACTAGLAHGASFDCKRARSPREKAVCADLKLSAADSAVAEAYRQLRAKLSPASAALVGQDQRAWLAYLDRACVPSVRKEETTIAQCLAGGYFERKQDLKTAETLPSGHLLFSRGLYLVVPRKPGGDNACPRNPGFGTGSFTYPQIDNPTAAEAAFNAASFSGALATLTADGPVPANFRGAADGDGDTTLSYAVGSANAGFLSIVWSFGHSPYCAAHPLFDEGSFNFWLDKAHPLGTADVFNVNPGKNERLVQLVSAKLHADKERGPYILDDLKAKGIPEGLSDPSQWLLSPGGLDVRFHRYQVAAYVAGTPRVHLRWSELQPLLNAGFHPETLPKLRKSALDQ